MLSLLALAQPAPAAAQGIRALSALSLSRAPGAESCPDLRELSRRVDGHLTRPAFVTPSQAGVLFDVTLAPSAGGGWRASIFASDISGASLGRRELTLAQPSCSDAADAVALALALMIDPTLGDGTATATEATSTEASSSPTSSTTAPPPAPSAPLAPAPPPPVPPAAGPAAAPASSAVAPPPPPSREDWRVRAMVGALGTVGQVPGASWGMLVGARFAPPESSWAAELGASWVAPRRAELRAGAGGEFEALRADARVVWLALEQPRFGLAVGPLLQVGRIKAAGSGFEAQSRTASSAIVNVGLELEAAVELSHRIRLLVRPSVAAPLVREHFEGTPSSGRAQTIFRSPPLLPALALGVAFEP